MDKTINKITADIFCDLVERAFKKSKPVWAPPHDTVYAVARQHGYQAIINGITENEWKKMKEAGEDEDAPERLRVDIPHLGTVYLKWEDSRYVIPYTPRSSKQRN